MSQLRDFLKLAIPAVVLIVLGMVFLSFTWGKIPGFTCLAIGFVLGFLAYVDTPGIW